MVGDGKERAGQRTDSAACKIQQGYRALQWFELEGRPGALTYTQPTHTGTVQRALTHWDGGWPRASPEGRQG